jgi:hypothetical protein
MTRTRRKARLFAEILAAAVLGSLAGAIIVVAWYTR